jgi:hypothetical protein
MVHGSGIYTVLKAFTTIHQRGILHLINHFRTFQVLVSYYILRI